MKIQSTSLVIKKIEIKTSMRNHFTKHQKEIITKVSITKANFKKMKPSFAVARNVKLYSHFGKQSVSSLKKKTN